MNIVLVILNLWYFWDSQEEMLNSEKNLRVRSSEEPDLELNFIDHLCIVEWDHLRREYRMRDTRLKEFDMQEANRGEWVWQEDNSQRGDYISKAMGIAYFKEEMVSHVEYCWKLKCDATWKNIEVTYGFYKMVWSQSEIGSEWRCRLKIGKSE